MPSYKFSQFTQIAFNTHSKKIQGQEHRCSDNYHFHYLAQGGKILWEIQGGDVANISFAVKEDLKMAKDPVIFKGLVNGSVTEMPEGDSIYIADVKQNGQDIPNDYLIKITVTKV